MVMHLILVQTMRFKSAKNSFMCLVYSLGGSQQSRVPVTHKIAGASPVEVAIENVPVSDGLELNKMQI